MDKVDVFLIRKARTEDVLQLAVLFDEYRIFYEYATDIDSAIVFLKQRLENDESKIFVAESDNEKLVGFVQLYPLFSSTRMKRLWLLNDLFVQPEYRGQGISKALIEKAKELCVSTNACGLILETAKSNMVGNQLYPATGFLLDETHNYYSWNSQPI